ncbi:MAG: DUF111 family protein [Clostridia bacterium]|nr:DUF111 family protein [Clostridia bacterium]MBQ4157893.1 DUF111 family protein [Clostridia bacterium]
MCGEGPNGKMVRLDCNVDDMKGEDIGFAREKLMKDGAKEVYIVPVQMKKDRPGMEINVICRAEDADRLAKSMLVNTSTYGVRRTEITTYFLTRSQTALETPHGRVSVQTGEGYGIKKQKAEYEDLKKYAERAGIPLDEARNHVMNLLIGGKLREEKR